MIDDDEMISTGAQRLPRSLDLTGREAACGCGHRRPSAVTLPFFAYRPDRDTDEWYDGCRGWD